MNDQSTPRKTVSIWYLLRYFKGYWGAVIVTMLFLVLSKIATSLDPIYLKKIIDGVIGNSPWHALVLVLIIYFGLKLADAIFEFLRDYIFAPAELGLSKKLSSDLFERLLTLQIQYHHNQKIGGLARQITRGGRAIATILDFLVINILPTVIELIIVTALLFKLYRPEYAIITFVTIIAYAVFTVWATEKRQKFRLGYLSADDEVGGRETDALGNIETIKYFNNESQELRQYQPSVTKRYTLGVISNRIFALVASGQMVILIIGLGLILVLAVRQALAHVLTIGDLVLLTTYIVRLSAPIGVLGFMYRTLKDGFNDMDGMAKILQEPITIIEPTHPTIIKHPRGKIVFDKVSFSYNPQRQILRAISFTAQPGQKIAFVGPSGVGKSTIVKLLFRLFEPTSGSIKIDDVTIAALGKEGRRNLMAIVPQDPALFNATIGDNIRFALSREKSRDKPNATQQEIEQAANLASLDKFIESLPDKYATMVGERGVKLSGGEKQRVAIARAVVRNPKILVFDEATSSLDSKSEKSILAALQTVAKGRTTLAIAHRLSTIANYDVINVLDKGQIVESGTHTELLKLNGLYAKLWRIQSKKHD